MPLRGTLSCIRPWSVGAAGRQRSARWRCRTSTKVKSFRGPKGTAIARGFAAQATTALLTKPDQRRAGLVAFSLAKALANAVGQHVTLQDLKPAVERAKLRRSLAVEDKGDAGDDIDDGAGD